RRSVWPLLIKHGVLFFLVGCERGQRSRFLAKKRVEALCLPFLPRAGSIQILPPGKPGTPPCKSGQLEKDLGLEVSSARHAARLIIFEITRSFFCWFKCSSPAWNPNHPHEAHDEMRPHFG